MFHAFEWKNLFSQVQGIYYEIYFYNQTERFDNLVPVLMLTKYWKKYVVKSIYYDIRLKAERSENKNIKPNV